VSLPVEFFRYSRIRVALATYAGRLETSPDISLCNVYLELLNLHSLAIAKTPLIRQRQPVWISA
jgi:hypothetical protein